MPEALRQGIEMWFDISYLIIVWIKVALMFMHRGRVASRNRAVATRVLWAFVLLGLGDAGHVGSRVFAYLNGGLEQHTTLVGIGALATAVTVTIFYMVTLDAWRVRYDRELGWFGWLLMVTGVLRLGLMMPAVNQWTSVVPPMPWGIIRNIPLMIQGLGLAWLLFRDSGRAVDRPFRAVAWMILVSYACYIPVILFAPTYPLLGMLMIPKTCAYLAVAFIAYNALFTGKHRKRRLGSVVTAPFVKCVDPTPSGKSDVRDDQRVIAAGTDGFFVQVADVHDTNTKGDADAVIATAQVFPFSPTVI